MEKEHFHKVRFLDAMGRSQTTVIPVVQELVRQGIQHLPERFITGQLELAHEDEAGPIMINMRNLCYDAEAECRIKELAKLVKGAMEWGMFFISNYDVSLDLLDSLEDMVKGFFSLPYEEKKESVGSYASIDNLGYGRSFVKSDDQRLDWIDRLAMRAAPKNSTNGLNVWPKKPSGFRQVVERYTESARKVCNELLQALAEALQLERLSFLQFFEPEESVINVRVNYYPPCPRPDLALGLTPHSDASALTLLVQFGDVHGLEVLKDSRWVRVNVPPQALLVNIGDLLEIMSNGRLKSMWHRVMTNKAVERFSVAVFYNPPLRAEIEPVQGRDCTKRGYKKVVVEDYLQHFYKVTPCMEKQAIKFAKF